MISPVEGSQLFCTVEAPTKGIGTVPTALVSGAGMSVVFFWMMEVIDMFDMFSIRVPAIFF